MQWSKYYDAGHCVKSALIRSFSGLYFPTFGLNTEIYFSVQMQENKDQKISEYGQFSSSGSQSILFP